MRVSKGGDMLAPGGPTDPLQFIDVRDLADYMCLCVEKRLSGRYNLCNVPRAVTMGALLEESRRVTRADTRFVWASLAFLTAQKLAGSDTVVGNPLPIWSPPVGDSAGAALLSPAAGGQPWSALSVAAAGRFATPWIGRSGARRRSRSCGRDCRRSAKLSYWRCCGPHSRCPKSGDFPEA
ncbi:MAG: hypothetical protein WDM77_18820 [Steroidobacteraceae bacterium]